MFVFGWWAMHDSISSYLSSQADMRDEALFALLIYTGLHTCAVQIRCSPASTSGWWSSVRMRRRSGFGLMLRQSHRWSGSV